MEVTNNQRHLIECTENLLESAPAKQLLASLEDLFFAYMSEKNVPIPSDEMSQHVCYLILFLRDVDFGE